MSIIIEDIIYGECVLDNYSNYEGFIFSKNGYYKIKGIVLEDKLALEECNKVFDIINFKNKLCYNGIFWNSILFSNGQMAHHKFGENYEYNKNNLNKLRDFITFLNIETEWLTTIDKKDDYIIQNTGHNIFQLAYVNYTKKIIVLINFNHNSQKYNITHIEKLENIFYGFPILYQKNSNLYLLEVNNHLIKKIKNIDLFIKKKGNKLKSASNIF